MVSIAIVARALNAVKINAQAYQAYQSARRDVLTARWQTGKLSHFAAVYNPSQTDKRISSLVLALDRASGPFQGSRDMAVAQRPWIELRRAITESYTEIAGMEGAIGAVPGIGDIANDIAAIVAQRAAQVADAASAVVGAVPGIVKKLLWGVAIVGAIVLVGFVVVKYTAVKKIVA